jgi:hypothetical protein
LNRVGPFTPSGSLLIRHGQVTPSLPASRSAPAHARVRRGDRTLRNINMVSGERPSLHRGIYRAIPKVDCSGFCQGPGSPCLGSRLTPSSSTSESEADLYTTARVEVLRPGATTRSLVMSIIPLDLQRRFEQRWAARFCRPAPPAAPQSQLPQQQLSEPAKAKRTTRRVKSVGLRSVQAV